MPSDLALLKSGLNALGVPVNGSQIEQFAAYKRELDLWNPKLNLVAASGRDLVVRHFLDCAAGALQIVRANPTTERIADLGTGAGLPGIPFAILFPEVSVSLVERSGRRVGFLRNAVVACRLTSVGIHHTDAASLSPPHPAVMMRAFHPFDDAMLRYLQRITSGGSAYAFKGKRSSIEKELEALGSTLDRRLVTIDELDVPYLNEERHLVTIRLA